MAIYILKTVCYTSYISWFNLKSDEIRVSLTQTLTNKIKCAFKCQKWVSDISNRKKIEEVWKKNQSGDPQTNVILCINFTFQSIRFIDFFSFLFFWNKTRSHTFFISLRCLLNLICLSWGSIIVRNGQSFVKLNCCPFQFPALVFYSQSKSHVHHF